MYANGYEVVIFCVTLGENGVVGLVIHTRRIKLGIVGSYLYERGHAVAQLVEALRYKPEGRGFNSRCCHWNFH